MLRQGLVGARRSGRRHARTGSRRGLLGTAVRGRQPGNARPGRGRAGHRQGSPWGDSHGTGDGSGGSRRGGTGAAGPGRGAGTAVRGREWQQRSGVQRQRGRARTGRQSPRGPWRGPGLRGPRGVEGSWRGANGRHHHGEGGGVPQGGSIWTLRDGPGRQHHSGGQTRGCPMRGGPDTPGGGGREGRGGKGKGRTGDWGRAHSVVRAGSSGACSHSQRTRFPRGLLLEGYPPPWGPRLPGGWDGGGPSNLTSGGLGRWSSWRSSRRSPRPRLFRFPGLLFQGFRWSRWPCAAGPCA